MSRTTLQRSLQSGFTLLELLVSLSILGVVSTLLLGGLRTMTRGWDVIEQRTTSAGDEHLSLNFLRQQLELAQPLRLSKKADHKEIGFVGERDALQFIAPLPGHLGAGGMYWFTLALAESGNRRQLVLSYQLFQREEWVPLAQSELRSVVLKESLEEVEFAYLEPPQQERAAGWSSTWEAREQLPRLIRVTLRDRSAEQVRQQEIIVAPRLAATPRPDA